LTVTGNGGPASPNGIYNIAGTHAGYNYYQRGTDNWFIWNNGTYWILNTVIGSQALGEWYISSTTQMPPSGSWTLAGGSTPFTGNATLAFGFLALGTTTPTAQLDTTGSVRFENFGAGAATFDANGN